MTRAETMLRLFNEKADYMNERIKSGVEKRKTVHTVTVTDTDGKPVSGVSINYNLKKHAFGHGANCFMLDELENAEKNALYRERFAEVFNLATLPFYWSDLEPVEGKPRFSKDSPRIYRRPAPDLCLEYCAEKDITPKLHCLNYDQWTPNWVSARDIDEIKHKLEKRIKDIAERYSDSIHCMEVINETLLNPISAPDRHSTEFFGCDDLISWSFATARKYLPHNELLINEAAQYAWDVKKGARSWYPLTIADSIAEGAEIDSIGLQYHMFFKREDEERRALPFYDPEMLFGAMDFYHNRFGKPLQVTEITIPAYSNSAEDEELQAKLIEILYSIWFSHPAMEAVVYWNLVDGYAAFAPQGDMTAGENYYHGGLLRFDFSAKPAFDMLKELFSHRFHTEGTAKTDNDGKVCFTGFDGKYLLTLTKNGAVSKHCISENDTRIILDGRI